MKRSLYYLILIIVNSIIPSQSNATEVFIKEWQVPWENTRPRDPFVGPDGLTWFVGQTGNYVANFNPATSEFERYDLEPGTGPHNLIVDEHGLVWFAGNLKGYIGRLNPKTGEITKYPMPDPTARDPHTLVFDGKGNIWFTVQMGNYVGRRDMKSGNIDLIEVPTAGARPYGIVVDRDARPWIVELGTNKLATVDPETLKLQEIELPRVNARPRRLGTTSDGKIWYVDYAEGYLGRYDPKTQKFKEWLAPSEHYSGPYGMAIDHKDRIWFVETKQFPNRFVGFDSKHEEFIIVSEIPSGAGSVRHMYFNKPKREIWFGTDTNKIGRVMLGD